MRPITLTDQGASRVALQRHKAGRYHQAAKGGQQKKNNRLKFDNISNLAGVNASVHVACAEHTVVQRVAVHVGSFAFLLGDEDNTCVQQLVGAVSL